MHGIEVRGNARTGYTLHEDGGAELNEAAPALYAAGTEAEARTVARFLTRTACVGASPALRAWVRLHWRTGDAEEEKSLDMFGGAA